MNMEVPKNDMAAKLAVGDWVLMDGGDDQDSPVWLGRVMLNDAWDGQGVKVNCTGRAIKEGGVSIRNDEVAINVQWYEKIDHNSRALDYHIARHETHPIVQQSRSLLHAQFDMTKMIGPNNPVPRHRSRSRRGPTTTGDYYFPTKNFQSTVTGWHDREFGITWRMNDDDCAHGLQCKDMQYH